MRTSQRPRSLRAARPRRPRSAGTLELDRGPSIVIRGDGGTSAVLAMTEIDWTLIGSALLLVGWFGFLLLLLFFSAATMLP
jgi:hypothetical protein